MFAPYCLTRHQPEDETRHSSPASIPLAPSPPAVPFIDQDAAWKVATILASLCGAAIVCCLLLPVETMGRGLSRRATRTRSLVPRGGRELPPDPAGNTSDPDKEAER